MFKRLFTTFVALTALVFFASPLALAASNETIKKVLERGKIVVGVKADYKPWGFRDPSGKIVGITEPNYYTSGTNVMSAKKLGLKRAGTT